MSRARRVVSEFQRDDAYHPGHVGGLKGTASTLLGHSDFFDRCVDVLSPERPPVRERPKPTLRKFSWEQ